MGELVGLLMSHVLLFLALIATTAVTVVYPYRPTALPVSLYAFVRTHVGVEPTSCMSEEADSKSQPWRVIRYKCDNR